MGLTDSTEDGGIKVHILPKIALENSHADSGGSLNDNMRDTIGAISTRRPVFASIKVDFERDFTKVNIRPFHY